MILRNPYTLLALLFLSACSSTNEGTDEARSAQSETEIAIDEGTYTAIGIETTVPHERAQPTFITVNGKLDSPPQYLVSISAPMGGFVKSTPMLQGMYVKKGQSVVELEDPAYIQLQQDYLECASKLAFARSEFERQSTLARENVNSQKTLQQAKTQLDALQAQADGLRAKLAIINLAVRDIESNGIKQSIRLYSPINGYVTQVHVNLGQYVHAADELFKIVDTSHLHAELYVFEQDVPKLKVNQEVRFTLLAEDAERLATIHLIGKEISDDRTVRIHCHLKEEDPALLPGMFIRARIEVQSEVTWVLPETSVFNFEGTNYVFATADNRNFAMKKVTTGAVDNNLVGVTFIDPLNGARVVSKGAYELLSKLKNADDE